MKKLLSLSLITFFGLNVFAAGDTAQIKSKVPCQECKEHLKSKVIYTSGIESIWYDEPGEMIYVVYDPNKVTQTKIETTVTNAGYSANGKKANPSAAKKLPSCCKSASSK